MNPVDLAALAVLPVLLCVVLAGATARISLAAAVAGLMASAPLLGYVYQTPPLAGLIALVLMVAIPVCAVVAGRGALRRLVALCVVGVPALLAGCAYWIVPSIFQLHFVTTSNLAPLSSWTWEEGRSTIANGIWLNTSWEWAYHLYNPYAPGYSKFPLSLLKFAFPLGAFGALALPRLHTRLSSRRGLVLGFVALTALGLILLSTGTRWPGSAVFDPLYSLPYGWLLREPGRFLLLASLCYAILFAAFLDAIAVPPFVRRFLTTPRRRNCLSLAAGVLIVLLGGAGSLPLLTGAVVAGPRDGFPSTHVKEPAYWSQLTAWLNGKHSPQGTLLALPADDFYQMPYRWYYGTDGFITQSLRRHVLDPAAQGYTAATPEVLRVTAATDTALARRRWHLADDLLGALGTSLVLVRGDLLTEFPQRHFTAPSVLDAALAADPSAQLMGRFGPLRVYRLRVTQPGAAAFATTNSSRPVPLALAAAGPDATLVTHAPLAGHEVLFQPPALSDWRQDGRYLVTAVRAIGDATPSLAVVSNAGVVNRATVGRTTRIVGGISVQSSAGNQPPTVNLRVPLGQTQLTDGGFSSGGWGPVGDCFDVLGPAGRSGLVAGVVAGPRPGTRAMQLSASDDSACVARLLSWSGGRLFLSLNFDHVRGAPARICLWEYVADRCADLPPLPDSGPGWHHYQAVVSPNGDATVLRLFLYADSSTDGELTINRYSGIQARSIGTTPQPLVIFPAHGRPTTTRLVVATSSASSLWRLSGSPTPQRVIVDGLRNGWLASGRVGKPVYGPARIVRWSDRLSAAGAIAVALLLTLFWAVRTVRRRRRGSGLAGT
jgi:hypothetical protein